jgi:hypothetical protein
MSGHPLFDALGRFRKAWVSRGWSWDRRFECVASTFDTSRIGEARDAVADVFPYEWTSKTLKRAPDGVQMVAEMTGGVRTDQLIYAMSDEDHEVVCYALWWPWGGENSKTISLRVGLHGASYDNVMLLREVFGALDD